jgi:methyl-accepting chemotaxis protein
MTTFSFEAKHLATKLAVPIISASVVFIAIIVLLNYYYFKSYGESEIENKVERSVLEVEQNIEKLEEKALWVASVCSELTPAKKAYEQYYETGDLQASSKIIEKELDNIMSGIRRDLGREARIHYHLPPATSFIRGWTDRRGDDVSAFRNTILEISETHEAVTGIEAGRGGFVIRALAPVFADNGKYYGSVELLLPVTEFIRVSKIDKTEEFALFMHTDMLEITTAFAAQAKVYDEGSDNVFGKLVFLDASSEKFLKANLASEEINKGLEGLHMFSKDQYVYAAFPVRAYNGEIQGVGVLQFDRSNIMQTVENNQLTNILVGVLLLLLLTGVIIWFNRRIIKHPMDKALEGLDKIKDGDLTQQQIKKRNDEIGKLYLFISEMQKKLHEVVFGMRETSNAVVATSNQLHKASENISSGSAEQASSAEEIASSIEEMSANITQNRDNAENTERIVSESLQKIAAGTQVMKEAVEANRNVIKKIGVVSEIAEKIDMLSINAGIQAGSSSGAGKEFSVIAAEIRKLADKTAHSADDINQLTEKNINLSDKTEKVLNEIMPVIQETSELVKQISAASKQQSHAADQINNSVQEFSNVTQRNADTSDSLLQEAEKLGQYAAQLQHIVSYFSLSFDDDDGEVLF